MLELARTLFCDDEIASTHGTRIMLLICHRAVVCDILQHDFEICMHIVRNRDWLLYAQNDITHCDSHTRRELQ